jgi:hypothetical protein
MQDIHEPANTSPVAIGTSWRPPTVRGLLRIGLPMLGLIIFVIAHFQLNSYYFALFRNPPPGRNLHKGAIGLSQLTWDPINGGLKPKPGAREDVAEILPNDILRHTGPLHWRFFEWGMLAGNAETPVAILLDDLGVPEGFMRRSLDYSNPTPFMGLVVLTAGTMLATRRRRQPQQAPSGTAGSG